MDALMRAIKVVNDFGEKIEVCLEDGDYDYVSDSLRLLPHVPAIIASWNEKAEIWEEIKRLEDDEEYRDRIYNYFIEDFDLVSDEIEAWIERKVALLKRTFDLIKDWVNEFKPAAASDPA